MIAKCVAVHHSNYFRHFIASSQVGFWEERIRTVFNYELPTLVQHLYTNMTNKRSLCILVSEFWKRLKWSWIMKLGKKKDLSDLTVFKSLFVRGKWLVIFVISKFFCQPIFSNDWKRWSTVIWMLPLPSFPVPALSWHHWGSKPPPLKF